MDHGAGVYRSLTGQPFGLALWEHARRMTTERSGPRPAEADVARSLADLLNRANGQGLTPDEAKSVAIDANRPARPRAEEREEPPASDPAPKDDLSEPPEFDRAMDQDAYDVFDPGGVRWRL